MPANVVTLPPLIPLPPTLPLMKLSPLPFTPLTKYHLVNSSTSLQKLATPLIASCPTGMNMTSLEERKASITLPNQLQDASPSSQTTNCQMSSIIVLPL